MSEDENTDGKKKQDADGRTKVGKLLRAVGGDDVCRFIDTCFSVPVMLLLATVAKEAVRLHGN